ncbi:MAG: L-alanyl-D/L-glutamate epimerase [Elusimicrobia bacterium]|nr:MAG: L-alanyl-D/L-glutamate epimerase [Elusimicrobiota bacterium]KAF0158150.1 MAG: L-alanyl-D/L-glutamate epimerase [Elusimicrobiota bacterium]
MKETVIKSAAAARLRGGLTQPFTISSGSHKDLDNAVFEVRLAGGVRGFGEAGVAPHITGETLDGTLTALRGAADWLRGRDIDSYDLILRGLRERLDRNRAALAAAEMAVLDALARSMKVPFWKLYGNRLAPSRTDITVVIGTPEQAFDFVSFYRARGMGIFKIKVGIDYDNDLRRLAAVRRAAPKARVFLDANCAWTVRETRSFIKDLGRAGIKPSVLEQPVKKEDFEGLAALSRDFDFPVCADESLYSLADAMRLLRAGVSGLNIKLMKLGLAQSLEVYRLARARGVKLMMGEMLESRLSSLCAAHFAAGLGGFDFIDLDTPFFIKDRVTAGFAGPGPDGTYDLAAVKAGIGAVPKILAER